MAFSVSPSVIVREVDASATVPAIATPPAAIAGVFRWGPMGEPVLITSENELVGRFGTPTNDNYETFFTAADYLSYSNALFVARADNGAVTATSTTFEGKYAGELGNSVDVAFVDSANFEAEVAAVGDIQEFGANAATLSVPNLIAFNSLSFTFEVEGGRNSGIYNPLGATDELKDPNRIPPGTVADGDIIVIGNSSVGFQTIKLVSWTETQLNEAGLVETDPESALTTAYRYDAVLETRYTRTETNLNLLSITKKWGYSSLFGKAPSANTYHVAVIDSTGDIAGEAGTVLELYPSVSTTPGSVLPNGTNNYYVDAINNNSSWINVANTVNFEATTTAYESLTLGSDGSNESTVSLGALATAYDVFQSANEIDISFLLQGKGDDAGNIANYIVSNIAESRKDTVAFLSPSKEASVDTIQTNAKLTNIIEYRNKIQPSSYWFMDSGYKYRYDRYNDQYRWVPLNGDMAGLCARVQPYESPAGFRKGVIKNVVRLAFNPNKAQRDQLVGAEVNPVISQVGQGIVLFADKTGLGANSAFDDINVRRLFIVVEKAIATAAQNILFELNDDYTQTQFKNIVDPFLRDIQGRRGIIDFRVVSDGTVNTPDVIDNNTFRANIFIKPARSINVIELTFVATRSGIEFEEIVGTLS